MLHLSVCAGLRVSELTGLRTGDVTLPSDAFASSVKVPWRERVLPLWKTTASALRSLARDPRDGRGARGVHQQSR